VHNWLGTQIFLSLECVMARSNADNLTKVFMQALMNQGDLFKDMIGKKLHLAQMMFMFSKVLG